MFGIFRKKKQIKANLTKKQNSGSNTTKTNTLNSDKKTRETIRLEKKPKSSNHITKHPSGGWQIKKSNSERAFKKFRTQKEAIEFAKNLEVTTGVEFIIHKADGNPRKKA